MRPHSPTALNVPNALTGARIALAPVVVGVLVGDPRGSLLAAALFAGVVATDALDGHIARSRNLVTTLGKVLDPLADKLLVGSVLGALVALDRLALWVLLVVAGREVAVTALRAWAGRRDQVVPASRLGKAKMALQALAIVLLLAVPDPGAAAVQAVVLAAVAATVVSGLDYAVNFAARRQAIPPRR